MKNQGVKFGLIYGALSIVLSLITYFTAPENLVSFTSWTAIAGLILMLACMYMSSKNTRDDKGGFIPFGEALIPALVTFVIGGIIGVIYMYVLTNFIDTGVQDVIRESTVDMQRGMFEMAGMPEDQILEALEQAEADMEGQFSLGALAFGTLFNILVMGLPVSAIIAAIVKKKEPIIQQP